jgi:hypothetical protein
MSFRLLSVAILLCLGVPALAKPPEVPLDPTITCSCCALAAEVPVDDLLLASLAEQRHSWDYRDLVLDTLVPVMRLRHLSPEHVKAAVDELRPEFDEAVEKWHDFVAQCTARPIQAPPARCEEAETEECEPADDVWEAQVELKNRRSGDVVRLPNVTIINGESDVQVLVDGQVLRLKLTIVEPVSVMPHEMEEVTVAPHEVGDCEEAEVEGAEPAFQVGEIIIVGNSVTPEEAVRRALPFEPGAFVTYSAVRQAETDLAILDYLVMPDSNCSVRASVTVLDEDAESAVKDILVTIEETPLVDPRVYQLIQFPSKCTPNKNSSEGEPQEAATDDSGVQSPPAVCPKPTPVESVCPYMRQKSQQHAEEPEVVLPASVEENLEKLLQARKALRKAEKCRENALPRQPARYDGDQRTRSDSGQEGGRADRQQRDPRSRSCPALRQRGAEQRRAGNGRFLHAPVRPQVLRAGDVPGSLAGVIRGLLRLRLALRWLYVALESARLSAAAQRADDLSGLPYRRDGGERWRSAPRGRGSRDPAV